MIGKTLKELGAGLTEKQISVVELTRLHLDRIARLNPEINAFITVDAEKSLARRVRGDARSRGATAAR